MLFEDFEKYTKEQWIARASKDLKGENVLDKYSWKLEEGIDIEPYYSREDVEKYPLIGSFDNAMADFDNPEGEIRVWENRVKIEVHDEKSANEEALFVLNNGATGILFVLNNSGADLPLLLNNILLNYCYISFQIDSNPLPFTTHYLNYIESCKYSKDEIKGSIDCSKIDNASLIQMINMSSGLKNFRVISVAAQHENYSHQISDSLIKTTAILDYLTDHGFTAKDVFDNLVITTEIGNDFFAEIAKIKAIRIVMHQLAQAYESKVNFTIHANCAEYNDDKYAPHGNMIKSATSAMSGILGGANSITVVPEDSNDNLQKRIARNVSNILKEESYLNKVADPAAGSYYITFLTNQIASKAWNLFKESIKQL